MAVVVVVVSMPSLVAMSTPSTVPDTAMLPVTFMSLLKSHSSFVPSYVIVALAPSIVMPAPLAAAASAAPLANVIFLSSTVSTVLLIVVVVPSICKSPAITTLPVLSPTPAGSIVKVADQLCSP